MTRTELGRICAAILRVPKARENEDPELARRCAWIAADLLGHVEDKTERGVTKTDVAPEVHRKRDLSGPRHSRLGIPHQGV